MQNLPSISSIQPGWPGGFGKGGRGAAWQIWPVPPHYPQHSWLYRNRSPLEPPSSAKTASKVLGAPLSQPFSSRRLTPHPTQEPALPAWLLRCRACVQAQTLQFVRARGHVDPQTLHLFLSSCKKFTGSSQMPSPELRGGSRVRISLSGIADRRHHCAPPGFSPPSKQGFAPPDPHPGYDRALPNASQPGQGRCEPGRGLKGMHTPHALQHPRLPAGLPGAPSVLQHPRALRWPPIPGAPPPPERPRRSHRRRRRRAGGTRGDPGTRRRRQFRYSGLPAFKPGPDFAEIASRRPRPAPPAGTGGSRSRHGHRAGGIGTGTDGSPRRHRDRHREGGTGPGQEGQAAGWSPGGRGSRGSGHRHPGQRESVPVPAAAAAGQHHPHRAANRTGAPGGTSLPSRSCPSPASSPSGAECPPILSPPGAVGPLPGALLTRRRSGFPALRFGPEPGAAAPEP